MQTKLKLIAMCLVLALAAASAAAGAAAPSSAADAVRAGLAAQHAARPAAQSAARPAALRAARVMTGTGAVYENGVVLIRDGKIEAVGSELSIPAGYMVRDFGNAVIAPGMVDPYTAAGAAAHNSEPVHAMEPAAAAEDVFDRFHADFERAVEAGVTSVILAPSAENLVGGTCAAVKTAGRSYAERVVRTGGPLALSLNRHAFKDDRPPTSRVGAVDLLRRTLEEARAGEGAPALREVAQGRLDALFFVAERYDAATVLSFQKQLGLKIALVNVGEAWNMMDELKAAGLPLIVGPFLYQTPERSLRVPGRAAAAGLKVAFTSGAPFLDPAALRLTAALAVRHGMDPVQALKAVASHPAEITGIAHRVGSIGPGKDADLAVYSGDPLDLASRVLSVYVDGVPAHDAPACPCRAGSEVP